MRRKGAHCPDRTTQYFIMQTCKKTKVGEIVASAGSLFLPAVFISVRRYFWRLTVFSLLKALQVCTFIVIITLSVSITLQ